MARDSAGPVLVRIRAPGGEALERLNGGDPVGMVLTGINMPEMDDLTLLKQIPPVDPDIRYRLRPDVE